MHKTAVIAAAALALTSIALAGPARASPTETPDYLADAAECPKAAGDPGTSWFCPDPDMTLDKARAIATEAERSLGANAAGAPAAANAPDPGAAGGLCLASVCWEIVDTDNRYPQVTTFTASGAYGYYDSYNGKSIKLGNIYFYYKVTANGDILTISPIYFRSTRDIVTPYLHVEVLYISDHYPQGNRQNPEQVALQLSEFHVVPANKIFVFYKPPSWPETIDVPTVSVEVGWNDSVFPGTWYSYGKSFKYLKGELNGKVYYWIPSESLPQDPAENGWRP